MVPSRGGGGGGRAAARVGGGGSPSLVGEVAAGGSSSQPPATHRGVPPLHMGSLRVRQRRPAVPTSIFPSALGCRRAPYRRLAACLVYPCGICGSGHTPSSTVRGPHAASRAPIVRVGEGGRGPSWTGCRCRCGTRCRGRCGTGGSGCGETGGREPSWNGRQRLWWCSHERDRPGRVGARLVGGIH